MPDHLPVFHKLRNGLQDELFRHLSRDCSEADWPVVSWILFHALFEDWGDIGLSTSPDYHNFSKMIKGGLAVMCAISLTAHGYFPSGPMHLWMSSLPKCTDLILGSQGKVFLSPDFLPAFLGQEFLWAGLDSTDWSKEGIQHLCLLCAPFPGSSLHSVVGPCFPWFAFCYWCAQQCVPLKPKGTCHKKTNTIWWPISGLLGESSLIIMPLCRTTQGWGRRELGGSNCAESRLNRAASASEDWELVAE